MKTTLTFTAFLILGLFPAPAPAGLRHLARKTAVEKREDDSLRRVASPDARLKVMKDWITRGTANGKLTKAESGLLTRELGEVEQRETRYRQSMNKLSEGERKKLHADITNLHERLRQKTQNGVRK